VLGAFTQLDTYAGEAASPLSLNRYVYAGANPWTLIDPSGHKWEQGPGGDGGNAAPVGTPAVNPAAAPSWTPTTDSLNAMSGTDHDAFVRRHGRDAVNLVVHSRFSGFNVAEHPGLFQLAFEHMLNQNLPTSQLEVLYDSLLGYIPEAHVAAASEYAFRTRNSDVQLFAFTLQAKGTLGMVGEFSGMNAVTARSAGLVARSTFKIGPSGKPSAPLFSQTTASPTFGHGVFAGRTIGDVAADLRAGKIGATQLPIDVVVRNGETIGLNTRSMLTLRRAGIQPGDWTINDMTGVTVIERLLTQRLAANGLVGGTDVLRITGAGRFASSLR
jgi:hypothetical protein